MDPAACLRIINDESEDADMRLAHMHYLSEWIGKGGFLPTGEGLSDGALVLADRAGESVLAFSLVQALYGKKSLTNGN
jgi:hypothetical protein